MLKKKNNLESIFSSIKMNSDFRGLSIFDVVQIVFLILKLSGIVNWSWLVVLSPFLISIILAVIVAIVIVFIANDKDTNDKVE